MRRGWECGWECGRGEMEAGVGMEMGDGDGDDGRYATQHCEVPVLRWG